MAFALWEPSQRSSGTLSSARLMHWSCIAFCDCLEKCKACHWGFAQLVILATLRHGGVTQKSRESRLSYGNVAFMSPSDLCSPWDGRVKPTVGGPGRSSRKVATR